MGDTSVQLNQDLSYKRYSYSLRDNDTVDNNAPIILAKQNSDDIDGNNNSSKTEKKDYKFSIGIGWIPFGYVSHPFSGLSSKDRYVPPHPDDAKKGSKTVPITIKDDYILRYNPFNFCVVAGYKIIPSIRLKDRFTAYFESTSSREPISGNSTSEGKYIYPPKNREKYSTGEDAYTFMSVDKVMTNDLFLEYMHKFDDYTFYDHWSAASIELGPSFNWVQYIKGWDRYGGLQFKSKEYILHSGIHLGINLFGEGRMTKNMFFRLPLINFYYNVCPSGGKPMSVMGFQTCFPIPITEIGF